MDFTGKSGLFDQRHHAKILNDYGIRPDPALQLVQQLPGPGEVIGLQQRIDGHKNFHTLFMRKAHQGRKFLDGEILGLHTGGKNL